MSENDDLKKSEFGNDEFKKRRIFEPGEILKTDLDVPYTIITHLGTKGLKDVYKVEYRDAEAILIWYNHMLVNTAQKCYDNLFSVMRKHISDDVFVLPEAITKTTDDTFGYIIRPIPEDYYCLNDFLNGKVQYYSWKILVQH